MQLGSIPGHPDASRSIPILVIGRGKISKITKTAKITEIAEIIEISEIREIKEISEINEIREISEISEISEIRESAKSASKEAPGRHRGDNGALGGPPYEVFRTANRSSEDLTHRWARGPANCLSTCDACRGPFGKEVDSYCLGLLLELFSHS